jgi:hypothetical protein
MMREKNQAQENNPMDLDFATKDRKKYFAAELKMYKD